ncbi:MAG: penicillin-binding protein [Actinomycetota bacterium]|nr:penicillin-binding protein [Actinomycetota bacterium]MDQ2958434.1 penicillin-binding protein [Actinomycetota bacterium]
MPEQYRAGQDEPTAAAHGTGKRPGWWRRRRALKKRRLARMSRRKRILRRVGFVFTWLLGLFALMVTVLAIGVYSVAHVPSPDELRTNQTAVLQYADGSTMATIDNGENRTDVALSKVPVYVRDAVIAAEDRGFYSEPGISIKGTLRAAVNDIRGGSTQGGSTITQQYVKNAYLSSDQTLSRKLKELAISLKLSRQYSKDEILQNYLNTIYFGRQAYGIESAAKAYFGVDISKVTVAQGALLAAVIKSPEYYDPAVTPSAAKGRWDYVVDGMVSTGKLSQAQRNALKFPTTVKTRSVSSVLDGPLGLVWRQVKAELSADGVDPATINTKGLRIQTTIDKSAQASAQSAITQTYSHLTAKQKNLRPALAAVNPATGGVLAYYGGSNGTGLDYVQSWRPPGSSFKPYVTATALSQNLQGVKPAYTIQSSFDGSSPQTIDNLRFENDPTDPNYGTYTLEHATTLSLNTVFGKLTSLVGAANVVKMARAMGIPATESATGPNPGTTTLMRNGNPDDYVGIGNYPVRILDQAVGYSTLADGGVYRSSYFIQKVTDSTGKALYQHKDSVKRVIDPKVANDVTLSMEQVASTSQIGLANGRPVAAKTGTVGIQDTADSSDGWTVGFTPQVSAASWVGSDKVEPIYDANGNSEYGRDLAGNAWKLFMDGYLDGKPVVPLPTKQLVGAPVVSQPSTTPTPTQSSSTPTPTLTPTKSSAPPVSSTPVITPTPTPTPTCTPGVLGIGCPTPTPTPTPTPSSTKTR